MNFIKNLFKKSEGEEKLPSEDYIEIDLKHDLGNKAKIIARPFILREFEDVDKILNVLREGFTIALIDIKVLKGKDMMELKRAIAKIRKTCDALGGDIAGFGENMIIVTPNFVKIYKDERAASASLAGVEKAQRRM